MGALGRLLGQLSAAAAGVVPAGAWALQQQQQQRALFACCSDAAAAAAATSSVAAAAAGRRALAPWSVAAPHRQAAAASSDASSALQQRRALSLYSGASSAAPTRRVPSSRPHGDAAGDAAAAAATGAGAGAGSAAAATPSVAAAPGPALAEMSREVPGGAKPLRSWEKWYWGAGVGGVSAWLFWRMRPEPKTPEQVEEERRAKADLEARRKEHLRAVLANQGAGGFVAEGDDPLDGLGPREIEAFIEAAGIDPTDPLEGMTPEEIDAFVAKQAAAAASKEQAEGG